MAVTNLIISLLNLIVLALTGFVVWLYTKAAERSNEIQEQPLLNFYFTEIHNGGGSRLGNIRVKNIGKGPAYNVSIDRFQVNGYSYRFYLETPMLESMEEKQPWAVIKTPEGATEGFERNLMQFLARLIPQKLSTEQIEYGRENPAIFLARYQGSNGKTYYSAFGLYCEFAPTGAILMHFIAHGSGFFSTEQAKKSWKKVDKATSPYID